MISRCVHASPDGSMEEVMLDQRESSIFLKGPLRFVGAIPDLNVVIVARSDIYKSSENNKILEKMSDCFFETIVPGDILFVGSDEEGEAMDVHLKDILARI